MDNFEKIESYLMDELSKEDRVKFEQELKLDLQLQSDLEDHLLARDLIEIDIATNLKAKLQGLDQPKNTKVRKFNFKVWTIAASLLICISSAWIYLDKNYSNEALFDKNFLIIENQVRGSQPSSPEEKLNLLIKDLENGQVNSVGAFQKFIDENEDVDNEQKASWYLALAYLKENNIGKTKEVLQNIISEKNNPFSNKASILLNDLNNVWRNVIN
ncbi:MAG TPA: hypothetical protein PK622_07860 [Saprospiraceae bacterium]|jgi:hypothetical protein|nr:hypothetical protein [Saprospiraceae bacterium]HUN16710.1 hypothetical protein [Saprospiraceae bacterium]